MSARGLWIVSLGAALAALFALDAFRSEEPRNAGADDPGEPPDAALSAQRPLQAAGGSVAAEPRADALEAERHDAPQEPQPVPVAPTPGPYASMQAALADHDVPPERRMPVLHELLETDRAFAAESVDPLWSTAAESAILSRIAEIPGVSYVSLNVECRTTLCLLQFVHPATPVPSSGIAEVTELVKPAGLNPVWTFGVRVRGGTPLGIAYLERVETAETPARAP